jgi:hypothetical protein
MTAVNSYLSCGTEPAKVFYRRCCDHSNYLLLQQGQRGPNGLIDKNKLFVFILDSDAPQYNCSLPFHPRFLYRSNEDELGVSNSFKKKSDPFIGSWLLSQLFPPVQLVRRSLQSDQTVFRSWRIRIPNRFIKSIGLSPTEKRFITI